MNIKKTKLILTLFMMIMLSKQALAVDFNILRVDQIEAIKKVEIVSQQITKAFFYIQLGKRVSHAKRDLKKGIVALDKALKVIENSSNEDQKDMVLFLKFSLEEMKDTMSEKYTQENGALMIDYSETILEGVDSLLATHLHKNDKKETALIRVEHMIFLLERITKYYVAFKNGFTDHNNVVQINDAILEFERNLKELKKFRYPASHQKYVKKLVKFWPTARGFYRSVEKKNLSMIVSVSTGYLEKSLYALEKHHSAELH